MTIRQVFDRVKEIGREESMPLWLIVMIVIPMCLALGSLLEPYRSVKEGWFTR